MKVGDLVWISKTVDCAQLWPEVVGHIGVIICMAKRIHIPAARVMVLGEIAEFDLDELETSNEIR